MVDHVWTDKPDGTITCTLCGLTRGLAFGKHKPRGACPKADSVHVSPALWQKAINFAGAILAQAPLAAEALLTGDESRAFRSQEEIETIAAICKSCPLFNGEVCTHKSCGCTISADRNAFWSKLAYKSQSCPEGKW